MVSLFIFFCEKSIFNIHVFPNTVYYFLAQAGENWLVHMKYFLAHEIMHSLGLPHFTASQSVMSEKPTSENDHKFKNVFRQFDSDELSEFDRYELTKLFLEGSDRVDWFDKSSSVRKDWSKLMVDKHPECENWHKKEVTFNTLKKPTPKTKIVTTQPTPTSVSLTTDEVFELTVPDHTVSVPTTQRTPTSVSFKTDEVFEK